MRYYKVVAEMLNFSKAAEYLFISQPALSQSIAKLETEIGVKLLERNQHEVRKTAAGELFLNEAIKILNMADEAAVKARQASRESVGSIKIGFVPNASIKDHLLHWTTEFRLKHPSTYIDMYQYNSTPLNKALNNNDVDIGFTSSLNLENLIGFNHKVILHDHLSIVMRNDHPFSVKTHLGLDELAGVPFVMLSAHESSALFQFSQRFFHKRGITMNVMSMPTQLEAVYFLVKAGTGLTVLPSSNSDSNNPELRFVPVTDDDAKFELIFAWKKTNNNPLVHIFIDFLDFAIKRDIDDIQKIGFTDPRA